MGSGSCKHVLRDHEHVVEDVAFAPATAKPYVNQAIFGGVSCVPRPARPASKLGSRRWPRSLIIWGLFFLYATLNLQSNQSNATGNATDGPFLASVSRDKNVLLYNAGSGQLICKLEGHDNWVRSVVFHPGGRFIFTAADDKVSRGFSTSIKLFVIERMVLLPPLFFSLSARLCEFGILPTNAVQRPSTPIRILWLPSVRSQS